GRPDNGRTAPPPGQFDKLAIGQAHGCAYGDFILPVCWGRPDNGRTSPPDLTWFRDMAAGRSTTCGLEAFSGEVVCFGDDYQSLVTSRPEGSYARISLYFAHACVASFVDQVKCWGRGSEGQTEVSDALLGGTVPAAGRFHSCAIDLVADTYCWGDDDALTAVPAQTFIEVAAGETNTCAIRLLDGGITCWGGDGDGQSRPPNGRFVQITVGEAHACALREDGEVLCWGKNDRGQTDVP
ncbi:MAG: hypothetical protein KC549_07545, partial [Myxococcales bacterium]|nr:hypothetical protein [Myxococcales bacterium]